jgi:hypothetical protein
MIIGLTRLSHKGIFRFVVISHEASSWHFINCRSLNSISFIGLFPFVCIFMKITMIMLFIGSQQGAKNHNCCQSKNIKKKRNYLQVQFFSTKNSETIGSTFSLRNNWCHNLIYILISSVVFDKISFMIHSKSIN